MPGFPHAMPLAGFIGGLMIGFAAAIMLLGNGRIAGVSGIASRLLPPYEDREFAGRAAFVAGLIVAPIVVWLATGRFPTQTIEAATPVLVVAGVLVGFGSVWGNGCTSGHGVCGLSRLSVRSLVATVTFMAMAIITVFIVRHWS